MIEAGIPETARGQAWSKDCREWVQFRCRFDLDAVRARLNLPDFVEDHVHLGTHDGAEAGLFCAKCQDGVMGLHPRDSRLVPWFR